MIRTPGQKAARKSTKALASFDKVKAQLLAANQHLDAELKDADDALGFHIREQNRHRARHRDAMAEQARNVRVIDKLDNLTA